MSADGGIVVLILIGLLFVIGVSSILISIIYEPDCVETYRPITNSHIESRVSEDIVSNDYEEYDVIINDQI